MNKYIYVLLATLNSSVVFSDELDDIYPHLFIGANAGYQFDSDNKSNSLDKDLMYGVYAGSQFSEEFSLDLGYQYHASLDTDGADHEIGFLTSALRYDWYFQKDLSLYLRGGLAYWNMDYSVTKWRSEDDSGFSPLLGAGVNYKLTPKLYLNAGYQFINNVGSSDSVKYDSNSILVGITYHFKGKDTVVKENSIKQEPVEFMPPVQEKKIFEATVPSNVDFGFDRYQFVMNDHVKSILKEFVATLNKYPQAEGVIIGHTDSIGAEKYNEILSMKRAYSVVDALEALGVDKTRLTVLGKGELEPIDSNLTEEGRQKNRRVELYISSFEY